MKVHYALAAMAASASALIAPAAMPRALVARPAPTADATVLEVPRPRPLSLLCPSTWLLRLNSPTNYSVAPESKLESELKQARQRLSLANSLVSVAELVFLQQKKSQEGVGFKPQSLRRRGFEPHRMHTRRETDAGVEPATFRFSSPSGVASAAFMCASGGVRTHASEEIGA